MELSSIVAIMRDDGEVDLRIQTLRARRERLVRRTGVLRSDFQLLRS